jgi:hypothetical protein
MKPILPDNDEFPPIETACAQTQEALVEGAAPELVAEHLKNCQDCRSFQAFWPVLRQGVAKLPVPTPAADAVSRVFKASLRDRRARNFRRYATIGAGVAVAASILIAVVSSIWPRNESQPEIARQEPAKQQTVVDTPTVTPPQATAPAIRDTILEARSTVVSNLQRTADETVESTLSWLQPPMLMPEPDPLEPLEPAVNTLSEVGHGAAVSVQPLTNSARRAVGLFWKELPSID